MNKVFLMGNLVADPEVYYSNSETPVAIAKYRIAINETNRKTGEKVANYINITAFGNTATFVQKYLFKGNLVSVMGHLKYNSWEDEERVKHSKLDVIADEVYLCNNRGKANKITEVAEADSPIKEETDAEIAISEL